MCSYMGCNIYLYNVEVSKCVNCYTINFIFPLGRIYMVLLLPDQILFFIIKSFHYSQVMLLHLPSKLPQGLKLKFMVLQIS